MNMWRNPMKRMSTLMIVFAFGWAIGLTFLPDVSLAQQATMQQAIFAVG